MNTTHNIINIKKSDDNKSDPQNDIASEGSTQDQEDKRKSWQFKTYHPEDQIIGEAGDKEQGHLSMNRTSLPYSQKWNKK